MKTHERTYKLAEDLEKENANLRDWIRQEGERSDVCTFHILGEICGNCACHRKSPANTEVTHKLMDAENKPPESKMERPRRSMDRLVVPLSCLASYWSAPSRTRSNCSRRRSWFLMRTMR
jgi:hypothetical protein